MYSVINRSLLSFFGAVILALLLTSSQTVFLQTKKGEAMVQCCVADSAGEVLPGASVTFSNLSTGLERMAITDASGSFVFKVIRDDRYRLTANALGFAPGSREVESGSVGSVDFVLYPAALAERVTVDNFTDRHDPNVGKLANDAPLPIYSTELASTFRIGMRFTWQGERK